MRTNLPVGDIADLQRFDTVCTVTVQHAKCQLGSIAFQPKIAGIDHIILFGTLLPGDLRGKLLQG